MTKGVGVDQGIVIMKEDRKQKIARVGGGGGTPTKSHNRQRCCTRWLCCCCCFCRPAGKSKCLISISSTCYALLIVLVHIYLIKPRAERVVTLVSQTLYPPYSSSTSSSSSSSSPSAVYLSQIAAANVTEVPPPLLPTLTSPPEIDLFDALRNELDDPIWLLAQDSSQTRSIHKNHRHYHYQPHRHIELVSRLVTLVLSIIALAVFLVCSLQKCANYANDSVKFGRDFFAEQLHHHYKHISLEKFDKSKSPATTSNDSGRGTTTAAMLNSYSSTSLASSSSSISSSMPSSIASPPIRISRHHGRSRGRCCCCCCCLRPITRLLEQCWRHFLPFAPLAHLISILLLLLPDLVFRPVDELRADIEAAYVNTTACRQRANSSASCLVDRLFGPNGGLLGKLVATNDLLTNSTTSTTTTATTPGAVAFDQEYFVRQIDVYSLELISLCLAFATLSIRYGSVFWYTNKTLSYVVTFIGMVSSIQQLFQLYSFLYLNRRIMMNRLASTMINLITMKVKSWSSIASGSESRAASAGSSTTAVMDWADFIQSNFELYLINTRLKLILIYSVLGTLVLLTLVPAYTFVYLKYKERFMIEEAHFLSAVFTSKASSTSVIGPGLLVGNTGARIRQQLSDDELRLDKMSLLDETKLDPSKLLSPINENTTTGTTAESVAETMALMQMHKSCCFNYCPHLIATIQLILICLCKLPFCYDYILYFNSHKDLGIMLCIIVEIMHTIILLFVWLILTLKTEWRMHLRASYSICHWTYHLKQHQQQKQHELQKFENKLKSSKTTMIHRTDKILIKGDETSRETEVAMRMKSAAAAVVAAASNSNQQLRCSLAHADEFNDLSVSEPRAVGDEEEDHEEEYVLEEHPQIVSQSTKQEIHHHHHHHHEYQSQTMTFPTTTTTTATTAATAAASTLPAGDVTWASFRRMPSQDDLNSETMYRNQIRKSIRNVLQHKRNSGIAIPIEINNDVAGRSQTKANRLYVHPQQFKIVSSPPVHIHQYQPPPPPQHNHHHHQSQPHVNHQSTTMTSTMIRNTNNNNNNNANTNSRNLQPVARLLGTGVYLSTSPSFAAESASALASTPKQPQIITKTTTTNNTTTPSVAHLVTSSVYEMPPPPQHQPPGQLKHESTSLSTATTTTTTAATSKPILYLNRPSSKEYESRV